MVAQPAPERAFPQILSEKRSDPLNPAFGLYLTSKMPAVLAVPLLGGDATETDS
jgi:hypothetical protein